MMQLMKIFIKREQQHKARHNVYELNDCLWGWLYILVWWSQYHNHMCTVIWWLYIHWFHNKYLTAFASSIDEYHMLQLYFWIVSVLQLLNSLYRIVGKFGRGMFSKFDKLSMIHQPKTIQISILTTNNLLVDLLICQTFFCQMLEKSKFTLAKLSRYTVVNTCVVV